MASQQNTHRGANDITAGVSSLVFSGEERLGVMGRYGVSYRQ